MADASYSTAQRMAFAGLVIGFLMCAGGAIAPFWQEGEIDVNIFTKIFAGEDIPFIGQIGDLKLVEMNGGLWWFCYHVPLTGDGECRAYSFDDNDGKDWVVRIGCAVNVSLTLLCALVALCRSCCCGGGKTICHGIIAFLAGGAGLLVVGVFVGAMDDGFAMQLKLMKYGWALYVYAAGASIVTVVSFMLCFASPNNPLTPVIINTLGGHMVSTTHYSRMDNNLPMEHPGSVPQSGPPVHGAYPQAGYPNAGYPNAGYPQPDFPQA